MVAPADADSRAQRIALLPIIVHTLREGLLLIEWHAGQQQLAPDWLVEAHRLALLGGPDSAAQGNGKSDSTAFESAFESASAFAVPTPPS